MRHAIRPSTLAIHIKHIILTAFMAGVSASSFAYTIPGPGDRITNVASGDFIDAYGNVQVINSNPVDLTITEVRALQLVRDQQQVGLIGGQISFPHTLTNTGNVTDSYQLSLTQSTTDNFNINNLAAYADRNQDGIPDDNLNLLTVGNTLTLSAGAQLSIVVTGSVPTNVSTGNAAIFSLTATSQAVSSPPSATVTDTTTVTAGAVINVYKTQNISTGPTGTVITYTLRYTNTGNDVGELRLQDSLPDTYLSYIDGSGRFNSGAVALTEAAGENAANSGINYQVTDSGPTHDLSVIISNIPAQSTGTVSFQVTVLGADDGTVNNTANYQQFNGASQVKNTSTNTVTFTLQGQAGVVLNINSGNSNNGGNPSSAPDNLLTIASASAGQEVLFDNYVWNTGNSTDIYDLSTITSNLPSCATVRLYAEDGRTLLTDSNGDGVVDTGTINAGASRRIRVGLSSSQSCQTSTPIVVDVTAKSSNNATISDAVRNQLSAITQGTTDLYNIDNSGKSPQGTDNAGAAFVTKPINPAGTAVFPLVIQNTGTQPNNYALMADDDGTLGTTNSNDLPAGWDVKFYEADSTDCSSLGSEISSSGLIAPNTTYNYCAVVSAPAGTAPTNIPIWFAIRSTLNSQSDLVKDQVSVQTLRLLTLDSDHQGQVAANGTIVYLHTLTNNGNVTEGVNLNDLTVSLNNTNANGFIHTVYFDANNNGVLDASDPQVTDVASLGITNGSVGIAPLESLRLLVKAQAPANATDGSTGTVVLTVTPNISIGGQSLAALTNTDITRLSAGQLRLQKLQGLDADCNGVIDSGTYSLNAVQVKPNQCVSYQIVATNEGATTIDNVVISDTTPAYTTLHTPPTPSVNQGSMDPSSANSNGSTGALLGNVGTLQPQGSASMQFSIRVLP